ncbi:SDR family NAD(P)-dependent oxidoreductase [Spiroplasma endosymbiont of Polydrusus cervinus]|uniref:SDR family NAD(P)-dependent oxidoreductase n=1 Tax=Spiroplasma endosymbiont of Polydrusus cervinus TaxID=3066287 RepID=UPI0030D36E54
MAQKKENKLEWAVVTGASKGLGYCYCEELLKLGYNVIAVARNTIPVATLQKKYPSQSIKMINYDLSILANCQKLFNEVQTDNVTILINNAGYGVWGYFNESSLEQEMNMIDLNIKALQILTKLFVQRFIEQNQGRVLNIGSLAAFTPAPVFASYYASKAYVWSLGVAINTELKKTKSPVRVITLCPGPLKTDFWNRSSNQHNAKYYSTVKVMKTSTYARKSLVKSLKVKRKNYIITGSINKIVKKLTKWSPQSWVLTSVYNYQKKRK